MRIRQPIIPREHGAWAVFLVPFFIGAQIGGGIDGFVLLFLLSSLGAFLSYVPAQTILRNVYGTTQDREKLREARSWTILYGAWAVMFILPVLFVHNRWLLILIGFAGMASFLLNLFLSRNQPKTIPSDLAAVFGLTLSAPSAYYVALGRLDVTALVLWLINVLFFSSSVFYVHMRLRALASRKAEWSWKDRVSYGGVNLTYHLVMIVVLVLSSLGPSASTLYLLAFAPITVNALWGTLRLVSDVNFHKLGFALLGHSVLFMFLFLMLFQ